MKITSVNTTTFKLDNAAYNKADIMLVPNENRGTFSMFYKNGSYSIDIFKDKAWAEFKDSANAAFASFSAASGYFALATAVAADPAPITAPASSNAATASGLNGVVTTESLTTAAAASVTITITNTLVTTASNVLITGLYTGNGSPVFRLGAISNGSFTVIITNLHASAALNAAAKIGFLVK